MKIRYDRELVLLFAIFGFTLSACGPRVTISTGSTIGLKATPGDGSTRPPQVTFGYKRTELALVPTGGQQATENADAFSTLASIHFFTDWFGDTKIHSVLGTGIAARDVQDPANDSQADTQEMKSGQKTGQSDFWEAFSNASNIPSTNTADTETSAPEKKSQ